MSPWASISSTPTFCCPNCIKDAEDPDSQHDFGHDILPKLLGRFKMHAYNFVDENKQNALYWRDVGTLEAYYEANMDVAGVYPDLQPLRQVLADAHAALPVPARQVRLWRARPHRHGHQLHRLRRAPSSPAPSCATRVLSHDVRVNSYADVDSSIIFSHVNIGRHCRIRHAIIDRDVHIPDGTVIGYDPNEDKKNYFVSSSGLTVVTRDYSVYENPVSPEFLQQGSTW